MIFLNIYLSPNETKGPSFHFDCVSKQSCRIKQQDITIMAKVEKLRSNFLKKKKNIS